MDKKTVFVKTTKGESEVKGKGGSLSGDLKRALFLIDDKSTFDEVSKRSAPSLRSVLPEMFAQLIADSYIRDKAKPFAEPQIAVPRIVTPASSGELDFTAVSSALLPKSVAADAGNLNAEVEAKAKADAARARAEFEAAVEANKVKSRAEADAKAEANAKHAAEIEARNRAEADAHAKQDALVRAQAEAKAKIEAEARMRAEQSALQAKLQLEAAAKAKVETEARIKQEIEAARVKVEQEAAQLRAEQEAARLRAEQTAARVKAELEAATKAKADAEAARIRAEQEAAKAEAEARALAAERARQEAEAARIKAEQEAARIKAEQEAAQAKAAAEALALAAARARQEAEAARINAEQEAARIKAEQEAAQAKVEAEARALAAERARQEVEAARIKAEHEAARVKAGQEAALLIAKAEADARAVEGAIAEQETAAKAEHEAARIKAEAVKQASGQQAAVPESHQESVDAVSVLREGKVSEQERAMQKIDEESRILADEQAKAWAAAEQRAKDMARVEAERPVQAAAPVKAAVQQTARKRRKPLPTGKIAAGLLVVLVLSMWLVPYVMPLDDYIAAIEKKLSAQFKQPVHVGALHAAILPWPKLQLEKVSVGSGQELKVGNAVLVFDPLSLFSPVKNIRGVELQDVTLDGASLEKEAVWLQEIGANADYRISHVTVQGIKVSSTEISLPSLNGDIEINGQGRLGKIALKTGDAKFDLTLQSAQDRWQVTLNAKGTSLPMFPNVPFEDFTASGEIAASGANFSVIDAQAYGGFLHGNAKLTWQKGWQLQGHIGAKSVELVKLFPKFGVSGELEGDSNFSSSASKLGQIADDQKIDGSFVVKKGIVNNMDMVETVRLGNRQAGRTHFDELTGNFQSNGRGQHFQQLQITSSILSGSGAFDVSTNSQISGRLSVELKARAGASSLGLSGTLIEPILRPGR